MTAESDLSHHRILVTNDDGIHARGLKILEAIARSLTDDVWVVAPDHERSGAGHSISMHTPIRLRQMGEKRYAVDGTPTDCALMAIHELMTESPPTVLLSGINRGANLAEDMTYSGTIAAAMEGTLLGIRSIALSQVFTMGGEALWATAEAFAPDVIETLMRLPDWPSGTLVNVNFPDATAGSGERRPHHQPGAETAGLLHHRRADRHAPRALLLGRDQLQGRRQTPRHRSPRDPRERDLGHTDPAGHDQSRVAGSPDRGVRLVTGAPFDTVWGANPYSGPNLSGFVARTARNSGRGRWHHPLAQFGQDCWVRSLCAGLVAGPQLAKAEDTFKFGGVFTLSGPASFLGLFEEAAVRLAVEQFMKGDCIVEAVPPQPCEGGGLKIGDKVIPIEWTAYDDVSEDKKSIDAVIRLVEQDEARAIWGPRMNSALLSAASILDPQGNHQHLRDLLEPGDDRGPRVRP